MRATLDDLTRDFDVGLARIITLILRGTAWILRNATCFRRINLVSRRIPIAGPLPNVAYHVVDTITVGGECGHRRGAFETILVPIAPREVALPRVRHVPPAGHEFVTPGKLGAIKSTARGKFPLSLRRQVFSGPFGVGFGVSIGNV